MVLFLNFIHRSQFLHRVHRSQVYWTDSGMDQEPISHTNLQKRHWYAIQRLPLVPPAKPYTLDVNIAEGKKNFDFMVSYTQIIYLLQFLKFPKKNSTTIWIYIENFFFSNFFNWLLIGRGDTQQKAAEYSRSKNNNQ